MIASSVIKILRFYQIFISPCFPLRCRFLPTCSQYMIDAIVSRGALRGISLGLLRLVRCHPLLPGGYDPAPEK